jgi:peptidoglycan-associated lipoprotein
MPTIMSMEPATQPLPPREYRDFCQFALDENIQWLKDHPNVHFYVHGYASSRGEPIYNLNLSQRRADWVKQQLVSRGVSESRIRVAVGWGELYPVCPELNDECWSKNRLVRFVYSPE